MSATLKVLSAYSQAGDAHRTSRDVSECTGLAMTVVSARTHILKARREIVRIGESQPFRWSVTSAGVARLTGQSVEAVEGETVDVVTSALRSRPALQGVWQ